MIGYINDRQGRCEEPAEEGVNKSVWKHPKRKKEMRGMWEYVPTGEYFRVTLDAPDPVTGNPRSFQVYDDKPDFNGWVHYPIAGQDRDHG